MIRVRIAPSPTGMPHIGTIWQALINYAYARHHQGKFIVRIEDTDQKRLVPQAQEALLKALDWFGLNPDESPWHPGDFGPYQQSKRLDIYQKYASQLVDSGHAYHCFCSSERLDKLRAQQAKNKKPPMYDQKCRQLSKSKVSARLKKGEKSVIRLRVPKNETIKVKDLLRGEVEFKSHIVDDQVILKSDGFPTYHLAVVVDDHLMKISHTVRGEEWLSSAPKHVLLYRFLGWKPPVWVHTPILRNPDKSKLSKRQGHTNVSWYQKNGYLPQALLNFLSLLGWSHPQEKTIFSQEEFIKLFEFKDLSPVGPVVDLKKLNYINGQYIRKKTDQELSNLVKDFINPQLAKSENDLKKIVPIIKERISTLKEARAMTDFFVSLPEYEAKLLVHKKASISEVKTYLKTTASNLKGKPWTLENITQALRNTCDGNNWHRGQYFMALRVAVTGSTVSPPLFESMEILGQSETLARLNLALSKL